MDIKQLRAFLAVANTQSFLAAADKLFISRQAVSKTITKLEEELGTRLFVRSQNGVSLTPAGTFFYHRSRILLADFDRLEKEMKALDNELRPSIRLCVATGADTMLKNSLDSIAGNNDYELQVIKCPDSDCDFVLTNLRTDAVISFTPPGRRSTISTMIIESPIVFLINKENPLSKEPVLKLSWRHRVSNFILYTGGRDHCLWWPGIPRPGDACSSDINYLFEMLRQNRGIMPLPLAMVPEGLDYAVVLNGEPEVESCKLYYSTLIDKYYDPGTFSLLSSLGEALKAPLVPESTASEV